MMLLPKYFASLIVLVDLRRTAKAALKVESRFLSVDEQILNPLHESKQFLGMYTFLIEINGNFYDALKCVGIGN